MHQSSFYQLKPGAAPQLKKYTHISLKKKKTKPKTKPKKPPHNQNPIQPKTPSVTTVTLLFIMVWIETHYGLSW